MAGDSSFSNLDGGFAISVVGNADLDVGGVALYPLLDADPIRWILFILSLHDQQIARRRGFLHSLFTWVFENYLSELWQFNPLNRFLMGPLPPWRKD